MTKKKLLRAAAGLTTACMSLCAFTALSASANELHSAPAQMIAPLSAKMHSILTSAGISEAEIAELQTVVGYPRDYVVSISLKSAAYHKNVHFTVNTAGGSYYWNSYGTVHTPSGYTVTTSGACPLMIDYQSASCPAPHTFTMKLNLSDSNTSFPTSGEVQQNANLMENTLYVNNVNKFNSFSSYVDFSGFTPVGDIDHNGTISLVDAGYVIAAVQGDPSFNPSEEGIVLSDCDVNMNGTLDIGDYMYYTSYLAGNSCSLWGNPTS